MERFRYEDPTIKFVFPYPVRKRIKDEYRGKCASCGIKPRHRKELQVHHRVPESMGGSGEKENGIPLCNGKYNRCHQEADEKALTEGLIFNPQTKDYEPITQMPNVLFELGVNSYKRVSIRENQPSDG